WSPDDPFLYEVYVQTEDDTIKSYFGMRKFSRGLDVNGKMRFFLNNEPLFLSGLLDQGYWSDGLVTCPDDKAMIYELQKVKDMGFNVIRKHVKIENRRWYYHCDRLGILVMQDMVNGFGPYHLGLGSWMASMGYKQSDNNYAKFHTDDKEKRVIFTREVDQTILNLYNVVSIFAWVPFNEGWGQFDATAMAERINYIDPSRLVDHASGWYDQGSGDFYSRHEFSNYKYKPDTLGRIEIFSAFGGYGYECMGHIATNKPVCSRMFDNRQKFEKAFDALYKEEMIPMVEKGLSGCIYSQLSDVENECNGLFTYDRKVLKVDAITMRRRNEKLMKQI
ncbi:MAG: glycoside hydrolase family 2, partial [Erysipelotrichaceae bacterium]|nr:glycoside hydrolase family 2 [Erysipelotrichaceae bacterium]